MVRIAMWSGPRNLSTAMMYAFAARGDCAVWDEPFYAAYLAATGLEHPMRADVLAAGLIDPQQVAQRCLGPVPGGKEIFYMKQMPHHMVDGFPLDWARDCVNVHLIRHPARVIASYAAKRDQITMEDIGFAQQAQVFERFPGPVLDGADIRRAPEAMMRLLCEKTGVPFTENMLRWEAGPKPFDGAWAPHWYNAVHASTGFAPPEGPLPDIPSRFRDLFEVALPIYTQMQAHALKLS